MAKFKFQPFAWLLLWVTTGLVVSAAIADQPNDAQLGGRFLRVARDKDNSPLALETAIVRHTPVNQREDGPTVDLISAVHIGEKSYYRQLNREFENYDAVLYELVAPEELKAPRQDDPVGNHPISMLQTGMKDLLALEFQLKGIDYTRQNMVHADMSPEKFAESMRTRGESTTTMMARMFGYALARQSDSKETLSTGQLLMALLDRNRSLALKRILAEQFESNAGVLTALDGPTGSTLISGRNGVALDVLREQLAAGKRRIAVFYGAAHMPDFQKRLIKDFALKPVETRWLVAWNLK